MTDKENVCDHSISVIIQFYISENANAPSNIISYSLFVCMQDCIINACTHKILKSLCSPLKMGTENDAAMCIYE